MTKVEKELARKKEITIPIEWIKRLQKYIKEVRYADEKILDIRVNSLLGYLESLDELYEKTN